MKSPTTPETAITRRESSIELWRDPDWQRLWLSIQARPWRALAIVPAGAGAPPDFTLRVAMTLARTGMVHLGSPVQVADATKVPLAYLTQFIEDVRLCTTQGDRILLALAPINENPVTLSIAQAADSALLCVLLNHMPSAQAKKTVAQVGFNRFAGSVIFHSADEVPAAQPKNGR
jgi:hypothetical protein